MLRIRLCVDSLCCAVSFSGDPCMGTVIRESCSLGVREEHVLRKPNPSTSLHILTSSLVGGQRPRQGERMSAIRDLPSCLEVRPCQYPSWRGQALPVPKLEWLSAQRTASCLEWRLQVIASCLEWL